MDSLNMSKLNLSVVAAPAPLNEASKRPAAVAIQDPDLDCEYQCEYREDIWKNLLQQEAEKPPIHLQSPQLEFRGTLVQQLRDVTKRLGLGIATLHSAVAQLDLFMDAHRLRADRLTHVALACLSIAAKSEEKFSRAPTLKTLSKTSGVQLCGKVFRQLEWMVGQHIKWRLLAPTPVTFAALLAQFVVTDADLTTRHPKFVRRLKRDGAKFLDAYLDLTLSDVRLKVVESVDVGCACVACARADLGLVAWPPALAAAAARTHAAIAPLARRLQRMMQILKEREGVDSEVDQGYGSARTSPNQTPSASPMSQIIQISSASCSSSGYGEFAVLDPSDGAAPAPPAPPADAPAHRVSRECSKYCRYCLSSRMVEMGSAEAAGAAGAAGVEGAAGAAGTVGSAGAAGVAGGKRPAGADADCAAKRYRLASHLSQVVL